MGIRSLLRNAFGRSKAAREESHAAPNGADTTPESATIPEAREESTPAAAPTPEPEVPAARTAPNDSPAPTTATLPAQGSPVDAEAEAKPSVREKTARDEAPEPAEAAKPADAAVTEPAEEPKAAETAAADTTAAPEGISALVSRAFDAPKPDTEPEAKTEPELETEPETEAEAVAEPETAPEAVTAPETAPEAVPEPEVEVEVAAETKPEPQPEPEPEPAPAPEPKAEAPTDPQTDEEPEAAPAEQLQEETKDEPKAEAKEETEKEAEKDTAQPSLSLTKVETTAPALVSLYKSASATLAKHNLATQRAAVYLVLDRSGSMRNYYKDGTVQNLAEQALGLSANLDDDGIVPVVFFSTDIDGTADLDLTNYEGRIEELHAGLGHMGRTNYHWAINAVVEHYKKSGSTAPAFVIFQTDGAPTSKPAAEKALCEAAELPIFWQFVGFGDPEAKGFDFLRKLDDLAVPEKRVVDNAGFFHAGRDPRALSADELYQQLMVEFPEWLIEARTAGVLKDN
ncbi:VWA domain-containing protein [Streptomyces sp. NPDC101227]|uniref:VWA domain-containing protein n=1 Tax=Streptomyces sp. NPDC101227 TaxID=3366136 RepID=UPI003805A70C